MNGDPLSLTISIVIYSDYDRFNQRTKAINEELGVDYGGHAVAIDKYPLTRFRGGAAQAHRGLSRYEVECASEDFAYDAVVLLAPGFEPIILSDLKFAYNSYHFKGVCSSFFAFDSDSVLSVKSLFGEVKGIPLKHCSQEALTPDSQSLFYVMSFEKVSLQAILLQNSFRYSE